MFKTLKAPVRRCAAPRVPISYAPPLEDMIRVSSKQIIDSVISMMEDE
jgi:pyruvate dehydrogenase E1 component beta subunit